MCTAPRWEECGCLVDVDPGEIDMGDDLDGIPDPVAASSSISSVAGYVFTNVWDANYASLVGYPTILPGPGRSILKYKETEPGKPVKEGTKLRILPVGDSITVGYGSERNGGNGNGYRGQLKNDLSGKYRHF
jgi:hypothetical protein